MRLACKNIKETDLIRAIAARFMNTAQDIGVTLKYDQLDVQLSITATHLNGCPLNLQELLNADDLDFAHDVGGIMTHCDHLSGRLKDHFIPRFAFQSVKGGR